MSNATVRSKEAGMQTVIEFNSVKINDDFTERTFREWSQIATKSEYEEME